MAVEYKDSSPWGRTPFNTDGHLGIFQIRPVPAEDDDPLYELEPQYIYRPDLLSYDIYGTPKLWWVFAQRNMDTIQDPVFDFVPGVKIYLPKKDNLLQVLGV
jgi:hypothetical protein